VRRLLGIGVGAGIALAVLLTVAPLERAPRTAAAVASSSPADGVTLAAAPAEVELVFTEPVERFHVAVRDSAGTAVARGQARLGRPDQVRQPVAITVPSAVTVAYHVSFATGQELTGTVRFGVGASVDLAPAPPDVPHGHDIDPLSAVLLVADGVVVVGAVLLLLFRRPRRPAGAPTRAGGTGSGGAVAADPPTVAGRTWGGRRRVR
jgi:methionine-rich copper-binding protein CopC